LTCLTPNRIIYEAFFSYTYIAFSIPYHPYHTIPHLKSPSQTELHLTHLFHHTSPNKKIKMAGLLGNVTNSLDNTVTGGEKEEGQGGLLGGVGKTVGKTVDSAGNVVGQTTDGVGNTVGQTTNGVADTAGKTTQGAGKAAGSVTDTVGGVAGQGQKKA